MSVRSSCLTQGQLSANKASGMSDVEIKQQLCITRAQGAVTCEGVSFHFIPFSALPNPPRTQIEKCNFIIALFNVCVYISSAEVLAKQAAVSIDRAHVGIWTDTL